MEKECKSVNLEKEDALNRARWRVGAEGYVGKGVVLTWGLYLLEFVMLA